MKPKVVPELLFSVDDNAGDCESGSSIAATLIKRAGIILKTKDGIKFVIKYVFYLLLSGKEDKKRISTCL